MTTADRETGILIGSDKVEGTSVYGSDQQRIGSIQRVMIEKRSGKVSYAVLSYGGFLGIGDDYYPLPWQSLTYNESLGGYQVALTNDQLTKGPHYARSDDWAWQDQGRVKSINDYYGTPSV